MRFNRFCWLALVVCAGVAPVSAQNSTAPRVVLVELFTSEGCSSCPPRGCAAAQAEWNPQRSGAADRRAQRARDVLEPAWMGPIRFRMRPTPRVRTATADAFASTRSIRRRWSLTAKRRLLGSDGNAILKSVAKLAPQTPVAVHIDSVADSEAGSKRTLAVTFSVAGLTASGADIYAVIADDVAQSSVQRGENSGRTLSHVSVGAELQQSRVSERCKDGDCFACCAGRGEG